MSTERQIFAMRIVLGIFLTVVTALGMYAVGMTVWLADRGFMEDMFYYPFRTAVFFTIAAAFGLITLCIGIADEIADRALRRKFLDSLWYEIWDFDNCSGLVRLSNRSFVVEFDVLFTMKHIWELAGGNNKDRDALSYLIGRCRSGNYIPQSAFSVLREHFLVDHTGEPHDYVVNIVQSATEDCNRTKYKIKSPYPSLSPR